MAHAGTPTKCEGMNCEGSLTLFQETTARISLVSMFKCGACGFQGYYIPESLLDGEYPDGSPKSKPIPDSEFSHAELRTLADLARIGLTAVGDSVSEKDKAVVQKLSRRLEWKP